MNKVHGYKHLYRRGKSETLYFRRAVPPYARAFFDDKFEVVASLDTANILEARYRLSDQEAIFEAKLRKAKLNAAPKADRLAKHEPSLEEIEAEVRVYFAEQRNRADVDQYLKPGREAEAARHVKNLQEFMEDSQRRGAATVEGSSQVAEWTAEAIIEKCGWALERQTLLHRKLVSLIHRSQIEAARQEIAQLCMKPVQTLDETFSDAEYEKDRVRAHERHDSAPLRLLEVFDAYVTERQPSPRTSRPWRRYLAQFVEFIGHDNAKEIEQDDVIRWKDHLAQERKLSPATINDAYLASLKTTLNYGVQNTPLETNVAAQVRVREKPKVRSREAGLSDEEALTILRATMAEPPARLTSERAFARRWVPWLCAFSGARVNEITQMRAEDIKQVDDILTMLITPEAGSVKNFESRQVPLHPQILDLGFEVALKGKTGPLFYDPARRQKPSSENTQALKTGEHLANWVRSIGVTDKRVQPNHGWRHRFKTIARRVRMDPEARDVIQGHKPRTEGERYGDTEVSVLFEAVRLLPRYPVEPC